MIEVKRLLPNEWNSYSESAHAIAFNEKRAPTMDRISFALLVGDGVLPLGFITCLELNAESVYIQHGGATPASIGTSKSYEVWTVMLKWLQEHGYKTATMLVKNTNKKMIRFEMDEFLVTGTSNFKNEVYIEFTKQF